MKKILFLFLMVTASYLAMAQKTMNEGVIVLELTEIKSDDPSLQGMLSGMKGGTMETVFTKNKQRSSTNMMGGMIKSVTYTDGKTNKSSTYMDMMGNKIKLLVDADDVEVDDSNLNFEKTGETKMINGFKTHQYVVKISDDGVGQGEFVMYVAEDIKLDNVSLGNNMTTSKIKGAPLEMKMNIQGMTMEYTLKKIEDKVPAGAFDEPSGYKEMSMEEFQKTMGGMGF